MFLQSLLHFPRALLSLSRYRRWFNKASNLKILQWFCSHCIVTWLLRLRHITGNGPVRAGKYFVVYHKQSGLGGFLLPLGRPGCKGAGPCHLYPPCGNLHNNVVTVRLAILKYILILVSSVDLATLLIVDIDRIIRSTSSTASSFHRRNSRC